MKIYLSIIIILVCAFVIFGQSKPNTLASSNILVEVTDDGATSELLPIAVGMTPNLTEAKIGIKYFGTESESDISFILIFKGTKSRYRTNKAFGVQLLIDDVPLSSSKYRIVDSVEETTGGETIHFYITTEDLAWLATAAKIKIALFQTDTNTKMDMILFTPANVIELKKFAKSVYLIRSKS